MTAPDNPNGSSNGSTNGSAYASAGAVAGLAREIEALRRDLHLVREVPARLDELAGLVAQLAEATASASSPDVVGALSWLDLPTDIETAHAVLTELIRWMEVVYFRYPDAAQGLPDCWLWHPDLIEELLWLMHAWLAAYRDENAPVSLAADWHDRYRPGVTRRISATAGRCSLENHQPRDGHPLPAGPVVPVAAAADPIATWWATHRTDPPPEPDEEHLATANARRRPGGRR
ncbi:MAG TPA: hypothetical protein VK784_02180 [Pseudonocardiaceae bacterium]|jgi:hypothetical protein|nr:hypothetical protein [Pseudonocardiaceae bacterium]